MQDLTQIYTKSRSTMTFNNFFKTVSYKNAKEVLEAQGLPLRKIIDRTPSAPGRPAMVKAHDLIALVFIQWLDEQRFHRTLMKLLPKTDQPTDAKATK